MSNAEVARQFFQRFGIEHDVEGCTPLFAENVVVTTSAAPGARMNFGEYKQLGYAFLAGCPDISVKILGQVESGDTVATRVIWSGTQTGPLPNVPPSGRHFDNESIFWDRFVNGQIAERSEINDNLSFLMQLGAIPPLG